MNWHDRALCAEVDPELWFPEKGNSARPAKRICGRCPVRDQCLSDALANGEQHGIWGGLNPRQRLSISPSRPGVQAGRAQDRRRTITALDAPEAAAELGVSTRTVQRWRSALRGAA